MARLDVFPLRPSLTRRVAISDTCFSNGPYPFNPESLKIVDPSPAFVKEDSSVSTSAN